MDLQQTRRRTVTALLPIKHLASGRVWKLLASENVFCQLNDTSVASSEIDEREKECQPVTTISPIDEVD